MVYRSHGRPWRESRNVHEGQRFPCHMPLLLRMRVRDHTNVLVSQLASKQLVGMLLIVIVKTEIEARFTQVQATSIGAGILGLMVCGVVPRGAKCSDPCLLLTSRAPGQQRRHCAASHVHAAYIRPGAVSTARGAHLRERAPRGV